MIEVSHLGSKGTTLLLKEGCAQQKMPWKLVSWSVPCSQLEMLWLELVYSICRPDNKLKGPTNLC